MNKKTWFVALVLTALLFGACNFNLNLNIQSGSGNVIREDRLVSGFDKLSLSGIGDVTLTQGNEDALAIEAEDNVLSNIKTEVRDGTLFISYEKKSVVPTKPIKFYLTMRNISELQTLGVSNIHSDSIQADRLNVGISGTGNVNINNLTANRAAINVSGAGNFKADGQVNDIKVTLSGAGNYEGKDLRSMNADVTITGLGRVVVWATDNLDIIISGGGGVEYYGNPQVSKNITGIGTVSQKGDK